jgi:hypothetical protein
LIDHTEGARIVQVWRNASESEAHMFDKVGLDEEDVRWILHLVVELAGISDATARRRHFVREAEKLLGVSGASLHGAAIGDRERTMLTIVCEEACVLITGSRPHGESAASVPVADRLRRCESDN